MKKIGISGGTFDPIHHGHLIMAEEIREQFSLDEVLFIPSGMPPHKNLKTVSMAEHRFNMVKLATSTNPFFETSDIEVKRNGYTYTIDTLISLKNLYKEEVCWYYIIGADVVYDICTWRNFEEVFKMCHFIAAVRPGFDEKKLNQEIEMLKREYGAVIHLAKAPRIEISSTAIRDRVREAKSIKYLLPIEVENYIYDNSMYK